MFASLQKYRFGKEPLQVLEQEKATPWMMENGSRGQRAQ